MSDWPVRTLDQLGTVERGKSRHRPRNDPVLYGGEYPFFQTGDVKAVEFYLSDHTQTYNEVGLAQSRLWEAGTLCITIAANIAESAVLAIPACFPDSVVGFIPTADVADVRFVKYLLDHTKLRMQAISRGTTQDNLSLDKLLSLEFSVPSLGFQQKIAAVLAAYDELIENNLRRIEILEEMAQAVYREWFVNFRFPGHEDVAMVDSALGPIPEGWEVRCLFDVADVAFGFAFKSARFSEEAVGEKVIRIRDIPKNTSKTFTDEVADERYRVSDGDVLIGMDGDFHMCVWSDGPAMLNQRVTRIRPIGALPILFLFRALWDPIRHFNSTITGTTVAHLGKRHLETIQIAVPSEGVLKVSAVLLDAILQLDRNLRRQNANLRATRDLLLPKLVSGEIDVSDSDIETEWLAS